MTFGFSLCCLTGVVLAVVAVGLFCIIIFNSTFNPWIRQYRTELVKASYKGLFLTPRESGVDQCKEQRYNGSMSSVGKSWSCRSTVKRDTSMTDSDLCCTTALHQTVLTAFTSPTGQTVYPVHITWDGENMEQYHFTAACTQPSNGICSSYGKSCNPHHSHVLILVSLNAAIDSWEDLGWEAWQSLVWFEEYPINSHCKCT